MKKIILAITGVVFVAVAAQAQSPRAEVSIANYGFGGAAAKSYRVAGTQAAPKAKQQALEKRISVAVTRAQAKAQQTNAQKTTKPAAGKVAKQQKPATTQVAPKKEGSAKQWLKAIFLGGKFPGESSEKYHNRLMAQSHPTALPFK